MAENEDMLDRGEDIPEEGAAALEKKYREQMRQIVSQKIELPISTLPEMIREQINLSPDFQRRGRWDQKQQSRFIESIGVEKPMVTLEEHVGRSTISTELESFMAIRNECAHTGRANAPVTAVDVQSHCNLLEELAGGIVSVLSSHKI